MKKIAIVTDSNSGITEDQGKELGIHVLPMPFYINEELFFENISLTQEEFYQKLEEDAEISTSQPSPGDVLDLWDKILEEYEEIVHIPMSSGLSSTCETAMSLAKEYDGRVQVVDNKRISVTMAESVTDAVKLRNAGKTAPENQRNFGAGMGRSDDLSYRRHVEVSEKGRKNHTRGGSAGNRPQPEAGIDYTGGEVGCICQGTRLESGEEDDAESNPKGYKDSL